jgi:hypothetical protein
MNKILASSLLVLCAASVSCAGVRVKTHHGFMGPNVFEATDGKVSVSYYNGNCCCVAEKVLESLAKQANSGMLDWNLMQFKEFRERVLKEECDKMLGK